MGLWQEVNGTQTISQVKMNTWRIVEDQSKSTTRKFVDTAQEHDLLEALIEQSKPSLKYYGDEKYFKSLHYLLSTPFRYPPLKWGSRFGTKLERGLLYASVDLVTAMSEKAFYKIAFLQGSEGNIGGKTLSYTAFEICIASEQFVDLCEEPFYDYENNISSKVSYQFSQALGKDMRNDNIECFKYQSARNANPKWNVGVFSPKALSKNSNLESTFISLNGFSTKEVVEFSFKNRYGSPNHIFPLELFLVNGKIPFPPN